MNNMKLNIEIERPVIFFDVETTGTDVNHDKIIEICAIKIFPDGTNDKFYSLLNPEREITPEATSKHGYSNEILESKPVFEDIVEDLINFFEDCDLGGHNSNHFDIPILAREFQRLNIDYDINQIKTIDTRKIYLRNNPKELSHLYTEYTGNVLENAHSAEADIIATIEIFNKQVEKYGIQSLEEADLIAKTDKNGNRFLDLDGKFIKDKDNRYLLNFGKHKGEEVGVEHAGFINWMLSNSFSNNTKFVAKKLLDHVMKKASKK